jgi:diguanylate cyclase (GGDEF)-like protein/PAS domain S-box-containing protein
MDITVPCNILLIEDDASDAHLVQAALCQTKEICFQITWVSTLDETARQLQKWTFDILLLDLSLPDSTGLNTVRTTRKLAKTLPIIVLTGHDDTSFALKTLEAGAQDYIVKGCFDSDGLVRAIRYTLSRSRLEHQLHDSEQRMALALSGANLGLWDWHIPSSKVIFSEIWAQMLGYSLNEIPPNVSSWEKLVHPADWTNVNATLQRHLRGETPVYRSEHRMLHKNQHWVWVLDIGRVLEWDANGEPLRAVGIHQDISQRKAAEARDRLLVSALKAVSHGVIITDTEAHIEWANPAFEKLTGYALAEVLGRKPAELVKSGLQNAEFYQALWEKILSGEVWSGEIIDKRRDGTLYHEELTIAPVTDENDVICHFVGVKQDISERKRMQAQLWEMATTDVLTGLINRRYFIVKLEEEFARLKRFECRDTSVLMLDIDFFKRINDSYGHAIGDAALKHFSTLIRSRLRKTDTVGRVGGEEFSIFLPDTELAKAEVFAQKLCQKVAQTPLKLDQDIIEITVSIGIAQMELSDDSYDAVLIRADNALYKAKEKGRNRVEIELKSY